MDKKTDDQWVEINNIKGMRRGDIVSAMIPIERLKPVEWNANEMDEKGMSLLKETISRDGFLDALNVIPRADGDFDINGGEHRWKVASELGIKELPCDIMWDPKWMDEELAQFQSVRSNVIRGKMNPEKFLNLYNKVVHKHGADKVAGLMGYTSQQGIDKIVRSVAKQMKDSLPPDMAKRFEEQAKDAKTTNDLDKIIKNIFNEHGDTLKYGFVVFSVGGQEHVYISATKELHGYVKKIIEHAKSQHLDANELIFGAFKDAASRIMDDDDF